MIRIPILRYTGRALALSLVIAVAALTPSLFAQVDTGGITGTVKDSSGAVMPHVPITLVNVATGVVQNAKSTSTGTYVYTALPPGTYTLKADAPGFKSFVDHNLIVNVQATLTVDITLSPGNVASEIEVTAAAPLLQTENAGLGQTVDAQMLNDLPLDGRDWVSLAQLAAGVSTTNVGQPSTDGGSSGSAYFVVNGTDMWQNDMRLNGINDNIEMYGGSKISTNAAVTPPPDAIQQFRLQSGNFNAEFGHSTGGIVNAVTRSGSNQVHGDVWDYVRNSAFQANSYFAKQAGQPIAPYRRNQFGGVIGGPIVIPRIYDGHNKTFFFLSYQGTRTLEALSVASPGSNEFYSVPTAGEENSSFTNFQDIITYSNGTTFEDALKRTFPVGTVFDPATTRAVAKGATDPVTHIKNPSTSTIYVRDPFYTGPTLVGVTNFTTQEQYLNQIPANRLDPNALALLKNEPAPTPSLSANGILNNYYSNPQVTYNEDQEDGRIDHTFGPHDNAFISGDYSHIDIDLAPILPGVIVGDGDGEAQSYPAWATAIGWNHVFSSSLVNEFHVGYNHFIENVRALYGNTFGVPEQFGIQGIPQIPNNGGLPTIAISGLQTIGVPAYVPTLETIHALEFMENLTKLEGSHVFKMGYQLDEIRGDITQPDYGRGYFDFNGQYTQIVNNNKSDTGITDMLLTPIPATVSGGIDNVGGLKSYEGSNFAATDDKRHYMGAYFQDDWKILPRLTLNLGLRWDYYTPYEEVHGRQANFIQTGGNGNSGIYYIPDKTCAAPRSAGFNSLLASYNITVQCTANNATGLAQKYNFAPRLGFNMRVTQRFVVRGGYGITYGALANIGYGGTLGTNYPFIYNVNSPSTNTAETPLVLSNGQTATMENTFSTVNLSDSTQISGTGLALYGRQYNYQTPYIETYNLMLQDQFSNHDAIQIGYVGAVGRHLDNYYNEHNSPTQILPLGTTVSTYLPFPSLAENTTYETTDAMSSYNALQTTYQHQFAYGLNLLANHTYSKCLTDQKTQAKGTNSYRAPWLPGFGIQGDYGLCGPDAADIIHVAGTYQLPFGRGRMFGSNMNRTEDAFVGGWATNLIFTHQSGQPVTVSCATGTTADFGCNANLVQGVSRYTGSAGGPSQSHWLNPAAFTQPPSVPSGTVLANVNQNDFSPLGGASGQARGPGFNNLDASLFKNFILTETYKLQFRAEAFNVLNSTELAQPNSSDLNYNTIKAQQYGEITALRHTNRIVQFAVKIFF